MQDDTAVTAGENNHGEAAAVWRRRFEAAWAGLNDVATMAGLHRMVEHATTQDEPRAVPVTGQQALVAARRVGLFPGSFNPLTHAHIALADAARRQGGLDVLAWSIAARTIDKEGVTRATIPDRLAQLAAYARWVPNDAVVLFNRGLYVEQVEALQTLTMEQAELFIIVGFDKIVQILDPHYYQDRDVALVELFARARLMVAPRSYDDRGALARLLQRPENARYADRVIYLDVPERYRMESSTDVRRAFTGGDKGGTMVAAALVPPEGLALTRLLPYVPGEVAQDDVYSVRARWLDALSRMDESELVSLPPLAILVGWTIEHFGIGDALRNWLETADRQETAASLVDLRRVIGRAT